MPPSKPKNLRGFPDERFENPEKLNNTQLPLWEIFFSNLRSIRPLEKEYSDIQSLIDGAIKIKRV